LTFLISPLKNLYQADFPSPGIGKKILGEMSNFVDNRFLITNGSIGISTRFL